MPLLYGKFLTTLIKLSPDQTKNDYSLHIKKQTKTVFSFKHKTAAASRKQLTFSFRRDDKAIHMIPTV